MMKERFLLIIGLVLCLSACSSDEARVLDLRFTDDILLPHTTVRNQGRTQTCWAYAMASLFESERLSETSDTVRLSVMYLVRQKYLTQFKQYYYSKATDEIRNGGLGHTFLRMLDKYGAMPDEAYKGYLPDAKYHDHRKLLENLKDLAEEAVEEKNLEAYILKAESLLDDCLGKVPERFVYKDNEFTPESFAESMGFKSDGYISLTSFTHHPFYSWFALEVPDNWENAAFYNLPIDTLEACVKRALSGGRTVAWDGDISEDGFLSRSGVALYPDSLVTQKERQKAFERFETTDDHMMHLVGMAHDDKGHRYYILKNSWGRSGARQGFIYMSESYFRAKTVSVVLPADFIPPTNASRCVSQH